MTFSVVWSLLALRAVTEVETTAAAGPARRG
jgi:hypothetical protein